MLLLLLCCCCCCPGGRSNQVLGRGRTGGKQGRSNQPPPPFRFSTIPDRHASTASLRGLSMSSCLPFPSTCTFPRTTTPHLNTRTSATKPTHRLSGRPTAPSAAIAFTHREDAASGTLRMAARDGTRAGGGPSESEQVTMPRHSLAPLALYRDRNGARPPTKNRNSLPQALSGATLRSASVIPPSCSVLARHLPRRTGSDACPFSPSGCQASLRLHRRVATSHSNSATLSTVHSAR